MLISKNAQFSNSALVLKRDFNLTEDQLKSDQLIKEKCFFCRILCVT